MTHDAPLVSIIIAVLNGAKTLRRCLDSILSQTYQHWELVILDGGSTDSTISILKEYDLQIRYWKSEPDSGIYGAWNKGLVVARGEWLCFIGADDYYASRDALAKMMTAAADGSEAAFISGRCAQVDQEGKHIKEFGLQWQWSRERHHHYICHPGSLHHQSLFARYGNFSETYRICGDYEFNLRPGKGLRSAFVDEVILCVGNDGVCRRDAWKTILETLAVQQAHPDISNGTVLLSALSLISERLIYKSLKAIGLDKTVRRLLIRTRLLKK